MSLELHESHSNVTLDAIRRLFRRNSRVTLYKLIQKIHPLEMAWIYRYLNSAERKSIFQYIRRMEGMADFLHEIDHALVPEIFADLSPHEKATTLSDLPSEDLAQLLDLLPPDEALEIQELLGNEFRDELAEVRQYADESAGRIISHEYIAFEENLTVSTAIEKFQQLGEGVEMPFYIYVVDGAEKMMGVLSLRQLLLNKPETCSL